MRNLSITKILADKTYKIFFIILSVSVLLAYGCGDDEDPTEPQPQETAKVQGRVTDDEGFVNPTQVSVAVENATVILAKLNTDGSMDTVSVEPVQTNAQGEFTIETTQNNVSGLIAAATKGTTTWYGVISGELVHNTTIQAQPLNRETTVEEQTYEISWEQNDDPDYVNYSMYINTQTTSQAFGNSSVQADIAEAVNVEVETLYNALMSSNIGATSAQINEVKEIKHNAQVRLEADLHFALGNAGAVGEAFRSFYDGIMEAYPEAEIDAAAYAKAKEISTYMLVKNSGNLFPFIRHAQWVKAKAITQAVNERFEAAGASQSVISAVTTAGLTLQSTIEARESIDQINQAYQTFTNSVLSALQQHLSNSSQAITDVHTGSVVMEGKNELKAVLSVATIPSTIIQQYFAFFNTIEAEVNAGLTGAADSEKSLAADILVLINMHVLG